MKWIDSLSAVAINVEKPNERQWITKLLKKYIKIECID